MSILLLLPLPLLSLFMWITHVIADDALGTVFFWYQCEGGYVGYSTIKNFFILLCLIPTFLTCQRYFLIRGNVLRWRWAPWLDDHVDFTPRVSSTTSLCRHSGALLSACWRAKCHRYLIIRLPPWRCWYYPRSNDWWTVIMSTWVEEKWIKHFQMSRETLGEIAQALHPCLQRQSMTVSKPMLVFKRVVRTVWWSVG